ncbi:MAG: TetR/AcrR family transcriptional regulator [Raoultibacter sp.]
MAPGDFDRRDDFVCAARELFEEKGLSKTTVKDITEHVGVTRSLFYHYFPDKEALTSAVLDQYVADFKESVQYWNESRTLGDVQGALKDCVKLVRRILFDADPFRKDLASSENAALYLEFMSRCGATLSDYVTQTTVRDYQEHHVVKIEYVPETFYMLIVGLTGFLRAHPDADDEVLMTLIAQTLRLDI